MENSTSFPWSHTQVNTPVSSIILNFKSYVLKKRHIGVKRTDIFDVCRRVKIVTPKLNGSHSELPTDQGGVVTRFVDGDLLLLESGSTVMHLIEKHDICHNLNPFKKGSPERAKYLQWFFYTSSTVDHLLFEAYKQLFVLPEDQQNSSLLEQLKHEWDAQIVGEFESAVVKAPYICGKIFTGADIMCGWSLNFAQSIGWLDGHPLLESYLTRLRGVTSFQKAFSLIDSAPFYFEH